MLEVNKQRKNGEITVLFCLTPTPVSRVGVQTQHLTNDGLNKATDFKLSILNKFLKMCVPKRK